MQRKIRFQRRQKRTNLSLLKGPSTNIWRTPARELGEATLYKLNIIFRKQLLTWSKAEGYKLLREFDLRAIQASRATWKDGALAAADAVRYGI